MSGLFGGSRVGLITECCLLEIVYSLSLYWLLHLSPSEFEYFDKVLRNNEFLSRLKMNSWKTTYMHINRWWFNVYFYVVKWWCHTELHLCNFVLNQISVTCILVNFLIYICIHSPKFLQNFIQFPNGTQYWSAIFAR